jgi:hypothetical protein
VTSISRESQAFLRTGSLPPPGLAIRVAVLARRRELDARLAAGDNPLSSRALALRARQLHDPTIRQALAKGIEKVVTTARRASPWSAVVVPRGLSPAAECDLLSIAARLRGSEPIGERGAAITSALISDGTGPLYDPAATDRLEARIALALRWLD